MSEAENASVNAERFAILKSVDIFSETPSEYLAEAVDLLQEVDAPAGETIINKGDLGTSMYVIVEGQVRVHDEERTLNYLGQGDVFGEMAALDPQPRSASVTAVSHARLFRLDQESLYELMTTKSGVTRGIVRILVQRLRARVQDMAEDYKYMQQFAKVTSAAVAVEIGEVYSREQRLKQEVAELKIEIDQVKQDRQVAEITETEYFYQLREKARQLRASKNEGQK
ncbi:MAG: cyclic nucleotide-binding domain-containing protein [Anaerolineales bacterium]